MYMLNVVSVPKFRMMPASPPSGGDRSTMTPAVPDHYVHVVLLPVHRLLLHTTPETEHREYYYTDDEIIIMTIFALEICINDDRLLQPFADAILNIDVTFHLMKISPDYRDEKIFLKKKTH